MLVRNKIYLVCTITLLAVLHLLSEYFRGGVVTHYLLADPSNPPFSNWWGLITLPVLAWAVLAVCEWKSSRQQETASPVVGVLLQKNYLVGGIAFGLAMGILWELGQEDILQYLMLLPWVVAPVIRIYLPETTLGFVLGMMYTFGGVLPIVFALVIQTVGFIIYQVLNRDGKWLIAKFI